MGRPDGDDAGAELDADGDVVVRREAPLAEADGEGGLAAARVADADELGNVVPRRRPGGRSVGGCVCVCVWLDWACCRRGRGRG